MYLLGISAFYHDSSACLFKDGELLFACEEEKFTGIKHDNSFPSNAIKHIFDSYNISYDDISMVCYYENLSHKFNRVLTNVKRQGFKNFVYSLTTIFNFLKNKIILNKYLKPFNGRVFYSNHHISHQLYSYYTSDYDNAYCLSIDGVGEDDTVGLGKFTNGVFSYKSLSKYPHSLGLFYSAMTSFLGFKPNEGEYKVMGLASYGNYSSYIPLVKKLVKYENGILQCDMKMFCWDRSDKIMYTLELLKHLKITPRLSDEYITQRYKDLAFAVQYVYEDILFKIIKEHNLSNFDLCLSGGSAYNGTANGKLKKITKVKNIWIPPAPSDAGSAVGACLYFLYKNYKFNEKITKSPFLGPSYEYIDALKDMNTDKIIYFKEDDLYDFIAKKIYSGSVVGWFNDNCEFGARALGNRSILGSPMFKGMKNKINKVIKKREGFRPFAPMVIKEKQHIYFDSIDDVPYMNQVVKVKFPYSKKLSEITHIDNTARIQTVYQNHKIYKLLLKFEEYSGYPILLNTSFNVKDKTMVLTPQDAINTFYDTEMDILVLGNYVILK